jgi:hypothetical protein
MTVYRKLWLVVCAPLAAVGTTVAFEISPIAMTSLFIYFGALGMLLTLNFEAAYWERSSGGQMRLLGRGAMAGGSAACSFIGFASLTGPAAFLLAVLVLASSPYAVRTYRRWLDVVQRSRSWETLTHADANAHPHYVSRTQMNLNRLTDQQLCQLWRASYLALLHPSAGQMAQIALDRQHYLDEFERRNRSGFAAWPASGPLASASPMPYLVGAPTINWDDLTREQES